MEQMHSLLPIVFVHMSGASAGRRQSKVTIDESQSCMSLLPKGPAVPYYYHQYRHHYLLAKLRAPNVYE
jgi:hypothetical protein